MISVLFLHKKEKFSCDGSFYIVVVTLIMNTIKSDLHSIHTSLLCVCALIGRCVCSPDLMYKATQTSH